MAGSLIQWLANRPILFDALRWVLEGGYAGHRRIISSFLQPSVLTKSPSSISQKTSVSCFEADEAAKLDWQVLDIGCGTGIYAQRFLPEQYVGIDLSNTYVQASEKKFPKHEFRQMDAREIQFSDGRFDAAFISGVLHHLSDEDAVAVLNEAFRVVGDGGRLVIWEDIPAPWWNLVGHVIHRLDLGANIRTADGYLELLHKAITISQAVVKSEAEPSLKIRISSHSMRSGFMDYAVFVCDIAHV